MLIFAKNKLDDTVYDKMMRGTDGIELHLDEDFINSNFYWNQEFINAIPIYVVHTPLMKGADTNIDFEKDFNTIKRTCRFANKIANTQNHDVIVVVHLATSVFQMKTLGVYKTVQLRALECVDEYKNIHLAIENISRINSNFGKCRNILSISFFDAPTIARDIAHPRVGSCIDICHALIDIRLMNAIAEYTRGKYFDNDPEVRGGLDKLFEINADVIKLIHFANCKDAGIGKDHGTPMTEKDSDLTKEILKLYKKYNYSCPLTLEVQEDDYRFGVNYSKTKEVIEKCMGEIF